MKKSAGRPPKSGESPMTTRIEIRALPDERDAYLRAADAAQVGLSDWIRDTLNSAAKRALKSNRSGK
jgi:uncharacterized protein (DUF1778 family)